MFQYINQLQFSNYQLLTSFQLCTRLGGEKKESQSVQKKSQRVCHFVAQPEISRPPHTLPIKVTSSWRAAELAFLLVYEVMNRLEIPLVYRLQ